jgi:transcriptional regulator with XRE-family HTH domain
MMPKKQEWRKLGKRLSETRKYRGYSQKEIAEYLGISRSSVSLIENGERKIDSIEHQELANFYNTSIDKLAGGSTEEDYEIELVARATEELSAKDREEVLRFAEFLRAKQPEAEDERTE